MLVLLPAAAILGGFVALWSRGASAGRAFLWTAVAAEFLVWASTEGLSLFQLLGRPGVAVVWGLALAAALACTCWASLPRATLPGGWPALAALAVIAFPVTGAFVSAVFGPPNMVDVATYHMPRVIYWLQDGSVRFFPTGYYQQISLQPLMEYGMAQMYALAGGDRFVQLVQWAAFLGSIGCSAIVARRLGGGVAAGWMAAVFSALLPMAVLQASGAKPDLDVGFWLLAATAFALEATEEGWARSASVGTGLAVGFAFATKGTAYVMAPGLAVGLLLGAAPAIRRNWTRALPLVAVAAILVNAPHAYRNWRLNGHPLGDGTADEAGQHYGNQRIDLGVVASNLMRNAALEITLRPAWSDAIYEAVLAAHAKLGLDPNDPATTWETTEYKPAYVSNHEGVAASVRHTLLLGLAVLWLIWRRRLDVTTGLVVGAGIALVLFCLVFKWQPWHARMHLPLYMAVCPVLGLWAATALPRWLAAVLLLWLTFSLWPRVVHNSLRPLGGDRSAVTTERYEQFFVDLPWFEDSYRLAADLVARSGCRRVGVDISIMSPEYPLLERIRELAPDTVFRHVGVTNSSAKYEDRAPFPEPCAVLCLGCDGTPEKRKEYGHIGTSAQYGILLAFVERWPY
jgi:hypothetical protein